MSDKFYLTTTLPYINADPHMGHALEFVYADIISRYHRLIGNDVFFNTGTDEHGIKVYRKACEAGELPMKYADKYSKRFKEMLKILNVSEHAFIRTTDESHIRAAQEMWKRCFDNGFIEKKLYKGKYCVGCELEKTDSELDHGKCSIHQNLELEIIEEENYFFKFSEFGDKLLDFYKNNPEFVVPNSRFNEIKKFVERGLKDFSISRLKEKMPWGVEVPGDSDHIMYVWFDALTGYISTLGWPEDNKKFKEFWGTLEKPNAIQIAGKDNLRQQSAMWQAMLMAAGLPTSKQIFIHGFITSGGVKMSKSLGNVIDPIEIAREFGADALRYYLAREVSSFEDGDFTKERFVEAYNANLANGLGNLVARIMKMAEEHLDRCPQISDNTIPQDFFDALDKYEIQKASDMIWKRIGELDLRIQEDQPFKLVKTDKDKAVKIINELVSELYTIGRMLNPIMPEANEKIKKAIKENKMPETLFPRID
ncbi:methionine--tRNA ligase [Patescibacteria group bacterium]|nr:methionine--tRNA ligase [Patescibacteria group bacterium]